MEEKTPVSLYDVEPSIDRLRWTLGLGLHLERPRLTKFSLHRWIFKIRFLCFGLDVKRKYELRVPKSLIMYTDKMPD